MMNKVILHCDMNNYFASVEEKYSPPLCKIPFAVCGDPEMRHSIVMSKNSLAKRMGVITGLSFKQAKEICPALSYVKADYKRYLAETKRARAIYLKYTDRIIPYGLDESWIDLTDTGVSLDEGRQIADLIRLEIKYSQGLSASVGVSDNLIFSKLGSDRAGDNETMVITRENFKETVWGLPASELLFVGKQRKKMLSNIGIETIGDIAKAEPDLLYKLLGKAGHDIWQFANGDDRSFSPDNDKIGSVGNTITPPNDLHTPEDVSALIYLIAGSVSARLKKHYLKAFTISICMKDSKFNTMTRQCTVEYPTDSQNLIFNRAFQLFTRHFTWENPLRSIGVRVDNLHLLEYEQQSLINKDDPEICADIDGRLLSLTERFGTINMEKTATTKEW